MRVLRSFVRYVKSDYPRSAGVRARFVWTPQELLVGVMWARDRSPHHHRWDRTHVWVCFLLVQLHVDWRTHHRKYPA